MSDFLVMNVNHSQGTSKKTGKAYDFTTLTAYKTKVENTDSFKGMRPMEFYCDDTVFATVPQLPAICEIEYDLEPGFGGQARMSVTSVKLKKKLEIGA